MTQKEINTLFSITIRIHEDKWFGKRKKRRCRDEVQEWVAKVLAKSHQIYTVPVGSEWGILTTKERFEEYWKQNGQIKL